MSENFNFYLMIILDTFMIIKILRKFLKNKQWMLHYVFIILITNQGNHNFKIKLNNYFVQYAKIADKHNEQGIHYYSRCVIFKNSQSIFSQAMNFSHSRHWPILYIHRSFAKLNYGTISPYQKMSYVLRDGYITMRKTP